MRERLCLIRVGTAALLVLGGCSGEGVPGAGGTGGSGGIGGGGGGGGAPPCDSAEMCEDDNDCTVDVCTVEGVCENTPVADETPCELGVCVVGLCEPVESVFPCSEQGIRDAVSLGGGPYGFSCEGPQTITTDAEIMITNDVILDGSGTLTVDGNDEHRLFSVTDGTAVELRRFILTRGAAIEGGGGAIVSSGTLTIVDSEVSASTAETFGGGITNFGELTIVRSAVLGSRSGGDGGGIMNTGMLAMMSTTVAGNIAETNGGGVMNTGTLTITACTVAGNEAAQDGGGIANFNVLQLVNSTVSGNSASDGEGGGIWNNSVMTMTNGTVSSNAASAGGAIGNGGVAMMVLNSLVDGDCSGAGIDSDGHNLESPGDTCGFDQPSDAVGVSAANLQLGPIQDNGGPTETNAIGESSAANDAIPTEMCVVAEDQRGVPRPQGSGCDIGAFERSGGG